MKNCIHCAISENAPIFENACNNRRKKKTGSNIVKYQCKWYEEANLQQMKNKGVCGGVKQWIQYEA